MTRKGPIPGSGRPAADIARIANAAHQRGQRMNLGVADHYRISPSAATAAIYRARRDGHDIPSDRPLHHVAPTPPPADRAVLLRELVLLVHANAGRTPATPRARRQRTAPQPRPRPATPANGLALHCDDCTYSIRVDDWEPARQLARHTVSVHARAPQVSERTPRHSVVAA